MYQDTHKKSCSVLLLRSSRIYKLAKKFGSLFGPCRRQDQKQTRLKLVDTTYNQCHHVFFGQRLTLCQMSIQLELFEKKSKQVILSTLSI